VRLDGDASGLGTTSGEPLAEATIAFGEVGAGTGAELWTQHSEAIVDGQTVSVDRTLHKTAPGTFVLTSTRGPGLSVDQRNHTVTVDDDDRRAGPLQLLVTFGLPLILHTTDALVFHAAACSRGDQTVIVCGKPGAGKSSLLVGLVDAGWSAVSEDTCAIDFRTGTPMLWPGPPWVRLRVGQQGPVGSEPIFHAAHKTGWDLAARLTREPRAITQVVLLEPPGGDAPSLEQLPAPVAIRGLASHAVWLEEQEDRGSRLFAPTAELVSKVPTFRLQLPRSDSWLAEVPDLLAGVH
jgi:hypothetical protein